MPRLDVRILDGLDRIQFFLPHLNWMTLVIKECELTNSENIRLFCFRTKVFLATDKKEPDQVGMVYVLQWMKHHYLPPKSIVCLCHDFL